MPERDAAGRMRRKRATTGNAYDRARGRALTRLSKLYPSEYQRLLADEIAIAERRAAREGQL